VITRDLIGWCVKALRKCVGASAVRALNGGAAFAEWRLPRTFTFSGAQVALSFKDVRRLSQAPHSGRVRLADYDPGWAAQREFKELTKDERKARASQFRQQNIADLTDAQERLYASDTHSVLIRLAGLGRRRERRHHQARHVRRESPGLQVFAFKKPSSEELDVLVVRVHPEFLGRLPGTDRGKDFWQARYDDINAFERHLTTARWFCSLPQRVEKGAAQAVPGAPRSAGEELEVFIRRSRRAQALV
jgi:hypothetical protein